MEPSRRNRSQPGARDVVRRGSTVRSVRGLNEVPADQLLSSSGEATETRRGVHRAATKVVIGASDGPEPASWPPSSALATTSTKRPPLAAFRDGDYMICHVS